MLASDFAASSFHHHAQILVRTTGCAQACHGRRLRAVVELSLLPKATSASPATAVAVALRHGIHCGGPFPSQAPSSLVGAALSANQGAILNGADGSDWEMLKMAAAEGWDETTLRGAGLAARWSLLQVSLAKCYAAGFRRPATGG